MSVMAVLRQLAYSKGLLRKLIRGDTSRVASNFSKLEANAEADLNLPVAAELFLRRARQSAKN